MSRFETLISPVPPGAGRFRDWMWPDPGNLDNPPTSFTSNRLGTTLVGTNPVAATLGFGGGTTTLAATINGIDCAQIVSTAAAGAGYRFDNTMIAHIKTTLNSVPFQCDDEQCFRVFCTMALQNPPTPGTDYGFEMVQGSGTGRILQEALNGFGFQLQTANIVNLIVRGPLGLLTVALTAAPFDTTQFHTYELRITSASSNLDAGLAVLIDNVPVAGLPVTVTSWAAGTGLPASALVGGRVGFRAAVYNVSGINNALFVARLRFMSAPTMQGTF